LNFESIGFQEKLESFLNNEGKCHAQKQKKTENGNPSHNFKNLMITLFGIKIKNKFEKF